MLPNLFLATHSPDDLQSAEELMELMIGHMTDAARGWVRIYAKMLERDRTLTPAVVDRGEVVVAVFIGFAPGMRAKDGRRFESRRVGNEAGWR